MIQLSNELTDWQCMHEKVLDYKPAMLGFN